MSSAPPTPPMARPPNIRARSGPSASSTASPTTPPPPRPRGGQIDDEDRQGDGRTAAPQRGGPSLGPQPDEQHGGDRHYRRQAVPVADRIAEPAGDRGEKRSELLAATELRARSGSQERAPQPLQGQARRLPATPERLPAGRRSQPARTPPGSRAPGRSPRRRHRRRSPNRAEIATQAARAARQAPAPGPGGTRDRGQPPSASVISTAHQIATVAPAMTSLEYPPSATARTTYRTATATAITGCATGRLAPPPCPTLRAAYRGITMCTAWD